MGGDAPPLLVLPPAAPPDDTGSEDELTAAAAGDVLEDEGNCCLIFSAIEDFFFPDPDPSRTPADKGPSRDPPLLPSLPPETAEASGICKCILCFSDFLSAFISTLPALLPNL